MARMEQTVEIRCLADKMFAYVLDARSWPQWHSAMLEAGQTSAGPMCIDIMFRGTNKVMGQRMDWTLMVTECVPDKKWGETISSGSILIEEQLTVDSVGGGTRFTEVYEMKLGDFLKLFTSMVISTMKKQMKMNLNNLKNILEAGAKK